MEQTQSREWEQTQLKGLFCQSCGMLMEEASDEEFGTNADGSKNEDYCSYCYQKGAFTDPDISMEEMIKATAKGWAEHNPSVSYEVALEVSRKNIPTLKRWQ
ncbi:zinc ribbon domain-containing protein [Methanolobus sp. ZRKC2]|uniref:zinc ribbon domain-containing protein n=1 Tax=Methanolobus sp. ZRKC2 TaxID=3125783 RepID=UPI003252A1E1